MNKNYYFYEESNKIEYLKYHLRVPLTAWLFFFVAFGFANCLQAESEQSQPASGRAGGLVVIAPQSFHKALDDYIQHKKTQLPVRLIALEQALQTSEGVDDPERLKQYLYDLWRQYKISYALLVGDADIFPVRYMVLDRITPAAYDYAFYPSDLYYADLARADGSFENWNHQQEDFHARYFGEVRGEKNKNDPINYDQIHYLPEIAVGRWPVSTLDEVKTISQKTIRYEKGLLDANKPNPQCLAMVNVGGWVDCRGRMDKMTARLAPAWTIEKRYYSDKNQKPQTSPPSAAEVVGLMNTGVGIICHAGHGQDSRWDQSLALTDLKKLNNNDRLPIIFSAGCSTARFATLPPYEPYVDMAGVEHKGSDYGEVFDAPPPPPAPCQKGKYNPPGMGEGLLRNGPDGAVAYIGCNTGSQPCGMTLMEGFVSGLGQKRLGDCWNHAIDYYYKNERLADLKPTSSWYPPSIFFQGMKFMLFGDPTLLMPGAE